MSYAHLAYGPRLTKFVSEGPGVYVPGGHFACGKVNYGNPGKGFINVSIEDTLTDGSCAYIFYNTFQDRPQVRRRAKSHKRDCDGTIKTFTIWSPLGGGIEKVYVGRIVYADFNQGSGYGYDGWIDQTVDISPW